jgi:hypothetical protein
MFRILASKFDFDCTMRSCYLQGAKYYHNFTWLISTGIKLCFITYCSGLPAMVEHLEGFCLSYNKLLSKYDHICIRTISSKRNQFHEPQRTSCNYHRFSAIVWFCLVTLFAYIQVRSFHEPQRTSCNYQEGNRIT